MGSKGIVICGILLAMVLLIFSEVAARELAKTSNTINTSEEDEKKNGDAVVIDPNRPCNKKVYGNSCVGSPPKKVYKRRCDYKNLCKGPGTFPTKDASTETIVGGQKTDAEVQAKPHN